MTLYEPHPLAALFPQMGEDEYEEFREDIRAHGLRSPIVLYDGLILDGRHRYQACLETGIQPRFSPFYGTPEQALALVISDNLRRRHLSESQRSTIAADLANMRQGERTDLEPSANLPKVSQAKAAEMLNVSERSVRAAVKVKEQGGKPLQDAVKQGKIAVSTAAVLAEAPKSEQRQLVIRNDPKEIAAAAKAQAEQKRAERRAAQQAKAEATMKVIRQQAAALPPDDRVRLLHGDALDQLRALATASVHLVVTSPPYPGVPDKWGEQFAAENFDKAHAWLDRVWNECIRVLVPGGRLVVNIGDVGRVPVLPNGARVMLYKNPHADLVGIIIWDQLTESGNTAWGTFSNPTDPYGCDDHEYLIVFRKHGQRESPLRSGPVIDSDDFKGWRRSIWRIQTASAVRENHTAPFPSELPRRFITLYTFPGETVLDPFAGSGTTLVEAVKADRLAVGIEHSADYIALVRVNLAKAKGGES